MSKTIPVPRPLTVREAAAAANCSHMTIRRAIAAGELAHFRRGRLIRVLDEDLAEWLRVRVERRAS